MECRICNSPVEKKNSLKSVISPWIREIAGVRKRLSFLHICTYCKGGFFTEVYSDDQMNSLYKDYRGNSYTRIRNRWEKWYTSDYNLAHEDETLVKKRKVILEDYLRNNNVTQLDSILDVGGDLGQYIPSFQEHTKKFVIDLSARELVQGVSRVSRLSDLKSVDLIIYSHVLEHVANPSQILSELLLRAKFVYVEVPWGVPLASRLRRSRFVQFCVLILSFSAISWSRFSKPSAGRKSTSRMLKQSEHLNFFVEETLNYLASSLMCKVKVSTSVIPTPDGGESKVIQALFTKENIF